MKLISLNMMEGHKHLDLQLPFFDAEGPDVLCLQEVFEPDFRMLKQRLGMDGQFEAMCTKHYPDLETGDQKPWGVAVLSRSPIQSLEVMYYFGAAQQLRAYREYTPADYEVTSRYPMLVAGIQGLPYVIGTTHFLWTPNGTASDAQHKALDTLLAAIQRYPTVLFCGDFNTPRGGEVFSRLSEIYYDHIPSEYKTSIDTSIHRRGHTGELDDKMVDVLFSTYDVSIANVRLINHVSDHMAIIAEIH